MLEAHRRIKKAEEDEKKRKEKDKADTTTTKHDLMAIKAYWKWKRESPSPTAGDAIAILRLLLPKVDTGKEVISTQGSSTTNENDFVWHRRACCWSFVPS